MYIKWINITRNYACFERCIEKVSPNLNAVKAESTLLLFMRRLNIVCFSCTAYCKPIFTITLVLRTWKGTITDETWKKYLEWIVNRTDKKWPNWWHKHLWVSKRKRQTGLGKSCVCKPSRLGKLSTCEQRSGAHLPFVTNWARLIYRCVGLAIYLLHSETVTYPALPE